MYKYKNTGSSTRRQLIVWSITLFEFVASVIAIYAMTVTFGASLFEDLLRTLAFSCLMSALCVMPTLMLIDHKNPIMLLFRILVQQDCRTREEHHCMMTSVYGIVGAWCGSLVIPLDWDRWWQEWPISSSFGLVFGVLIGAIVSIKFKKNIKPHL